MATLEELERRLQVLEDIEAVRQTKYDYWHGLDLKDWDRVNDAFTEDVKAHYGRPEWSFEGRDYTCGCPVDQNLRARAIFLNLDKPALACVKCCRPPALWSRLPDL